MRTPRNFLLALASILVASAACRTSAPPEPAKTWQYPEARRGDVVDDLHGTKVADPYRWMEEVDSAETRAWIDAENRLTESYLAAIPERRALADRLQQLWDYERLGVPYVRGGRMFFTRNSGLQAQSALCVVDVPGGERRVLLDPNTLSSDGTVALMGESVSDDGRYLAYGLSSAGSDWQEWRVRDVLSTLDAHDHLRWTKFTRAAWTGDSQGFYYARFDPPAAGAELKAANYYQKLCYHHLGALQEDDEIVYRRDDHKDWEFSPEVTDDGRYLIITVHVGADRRTMVFFRDLERPGSPVVELLHDFDAEYSFIGNDGPVFFFRTNQGAPLGRVIAVDTRDPGRSAWRVIISEQPAALVRVSLIHNTFVAVFLKDATTRVRLFRMNGDDDGEIALPGLGSASGFSGRRGDRETFFSFSSFTTPATSYRYDFESGKTTLVAQPSVAADLSRFVTTQVFYPSKDGTKVPMFITHLKGMSLDGRNPTLLYAYGGFNIPMTPSFSVPNLVWMEHGGIYAVANLRGGGEYGETWHKAGMRERKQTVFDDFIAAAEWLIANRYTSRDKLAIYGGSNGGLLVGAVLNQRPDLFGAAVPAVGVMDMLRYHKFTVGWGWMAEYGSADDPAMLPVLLRYSPLHNIKAGASYPPTLVLTADHDDRVIPAHSFKYAAALQAAQKGSAPILIRISSRAGHGGGKPTQKQIAEAADRLAFLVKALRMER